MRRPELLVSAQNLDQLKTAAKAGADAVSFGGGPFAPRAFSYAETAEGIASAHRCGVKAYIDMGLLAHNGDLQEVEAHLCRLKEQGPDALILSDPGVFAMAKRICPKIPIHIGEQANSVNYGAFLFWHRQGAARAAVAADLPLEDINEIRRRIPGGMEIEAFVHGARRIFQSGRRLIASCRKGRGEAEGLLPVGWGYSIVEETRPNEPMPVFEDERGTYFFGSGDFCRLDDLRKLAQAGVDSVRIEGACKELSSLMAVTETCRAALDGLL